MGLENCGILVSLGYPLPNSELIFQLEKGQQLWTVMINLSQSTCPGDSGKSKTTKLTTCEPALSEGAPLQGLLTQGAEGGSQLVQAWCQDVLSAVQEEDLRPGIELQEKLPGTISPGHDSLGAAEDPGTSVIQDEEENISKCKECEKVFNKKHLLAGHLKIHSGVKPYERTECGKTFIKSTHLLQHQMVHTGERP
ncbi:Zinc finger protein 264 [Sciurus carolinensis]|uniref:Zinc finger protein 264 n=1 Tax=Sciurus carolinensis TaxID=30640 RepID=A0AA41MDH4_SCICA|nr:Zinc finger protein 264 [Sciurus carolinensis]